MRKFLIVAAVATAFLAVTGTANAAFYRYRLGSSYNLGHNVHRYNGRAVFSRLGFADYEFRMPQWASQARTTEWYVGTCRGRLSHLYGRHYVLAMGCTGGSRIRLVRIRFLV